MTKLKVWSPFAPMWSNSGLWPDDLDVSFDEDNELDMYETDEQVVVEVKCPGFTAEDIEVTLEGGVLSIKGESKEESEEENKKKKYYRKEIQRKSFTRSVTLPVPVKESEVEATFINGMLKLALPKAEEAKPKQIRINVK